MIGAFLIAASLAVYAKALHKAGGRLKIKVEKNAGRVGDHIWLSLNYVVPDGAQLQDSPVIEGIEGFSVVGTKVRENHIEVSMLVDRLQPFEIGPIALVYTDRDGKEQRLTAAPVTIEVISNLGENPDDAALKPIQEIIPTMFPWYIHLLWKAIAVALVGLAAGTWYWRRRRSSMVNEDDEIEPPHVSAEREIDLLLKDGIFERGDVKTFYFRLSEIIRRYMEDIRGFPAAEMTTEEIARNLETQGSDRTILPLLRQADLVKFADSVPSPSRKDQDVMDTHMYINNTSLQVWKPTEVKPASEVAS